MGPQPTIFHSLFGDNRKTLRLAAITCEIFYREMCLAVARSPSMVDIVFLPKGLHDVGPQKMSARLREAIQNLDESRYDAVCLGYALCNNGIIGLAAERLPLVVARAHDCITLFLGSHQRYMEYFQANPGVYFQTPGWIERGEDLSQYAADSILSKMGLMQSYEDWVAKYGEDNARFLQQQLADLTRHYGKIAYIRTNTGCDAMFEQLAREKAAAKGWKFEVLEGDLRLLQKLVNGQWDEEEFLIVPPNHRIAPSFDDRIIRAEPVSTAVTA